MPLSKLDLTRPTAIPRAGGLRKAALAAFMGYLCLLSYLSLVPVVPGAAEISDKTLHFIAYGGLATLAAAAWPKAALLPMFIVLSAIGGLLELTQGVLNLGRVASFGDQIANMGGVALALLLWILLVWLITAFTQKS